jgi:hypothetical protein
MLTPDEQKQLQQLNLKLDNLQGQIAAQAKRVLTTSDRKFLLDLVTQVVKPPLVNATIGAGQVVLAAATSATVIEQNEINWSTTIVNAGDADAYLSFQQGPAVTLRGMLLLAHGGSVTFGRGTDIPYLGRVTGFSTAGTTLVFVQFSMPTNTNIEL